MLKSEKVVHVNVKTTEHHYCLFSTNEMFGDKNLSKETANAGLFKHAQYVLYRSTV